MELFMPGKRILEAICWDDSAQRQYVTFPANAGEVILVSYLDNVRMQVEWLYRHWFKVEFDKINGQKILVPWEALHNSWVHGSKDGNPFTYGFFAAKKGVCHGFKDGGGYFKNKKVKLVYENKVPLKKFDKSVDGHRIGVNYYIYPNSDIIEVDTSSGVLYCAQFVENFLQK
jgi:hypothetical protein